MMKKVMILNNNSTGIGRVIIVLIEKYKDQIVFDKAKNTGVFVRVDRSHIIVKIGEKEYKPYPLNSFDTGTLAFQNIDVQKKYMDDVAAAKAARPAAKIVTQTSKKTNSRQKTTKVKKTIDDMIDPGYNVVHLSRTPIYTYEDVEKLFGIKRHGYGKGTNVSGNRIILISSMEKKDGEYVYHDHWTETGEYVYSGEGRSGDQKMTGGNKAIADSQNEGNEIHLLIKFSSKEYYYQGEFVLVDTKYEDDTDENGMSRKEYKFILRRK